MSAPPEENDNIFDEDGNIKPEFLPDFLRDDDDQKLLPENAESLQGGLTLEDVIKQLRDQGIPVRVNYYDEEGNLVSSEGDVEEFNAHDAKWDTSAQKELVDMAVDQCLDALSALSAARANFLAANVLLAQSPEDHNLLARQGTFEKLTSILDVALTSVSRLPTIGEEILILSRIRPFLNGNQGEK